MLLILRMNKKSLIVRIGMKLSKQEMKKYQAWNKEYPADEWEIERNKRIAKKQGNVNPFISKH